VVLGSKPLYSLSPYHAWAEGVVLSSALGNIVTTSSSIETERLDASADEEALVGRHRMDRLRANRMSGSPPAERPAREHENLPGWTPSRRAELRASEKIEAPISSFAPQRPQFLGIPSELR